MVCMFAWFPVVSEWVVFWTFFKLQLFAFAAISAIIQPTRQTNLRLFILFHLEQIKPSPSIIFHFHVHCVWILNSSLAIPKKLQVTVSLEQFNWKNQLNPQLLIVRGKIHGFFLVKISLQSSDSRFSNENRMYDCTIVMNLTLLFGTSPQHPSKITN